MLPANLLRIGARRANIGARFNRADVFQVDVDTYTGNALMQQDNAYAARDPTIITNAIMSALGGVLADHAADYPNRDYSLQASLALQNDTTVNVLSGMRVPHDQFYVTLWNRVHAAVVINLGRMRTAAQTGNTDYDELFWWNRVLVRVAYRQPRAGGCDAFAHTRVFQSEDGEIKIHARSLRTKNDNCALLCIIQSLKLIQLHESNAFPDGLIKTAAKMRNVCKIPTGTVSVEDFGAICARFELSYIIYDGTFDLASRKANVIAGNQYKHELLEVVLFDGHYYHVQKIKDSSELVYCEDCRVSFKKRADGSHKHSCTVRCELCGHVSRPGHQCALNIEPLQGEPGPSMRRTVDFGTGVIADEHMESDEIVKAIGDAMSIDKHVLIHGPGGCGKSFVIENVMKFLRARGLTVQCVAPTATAALLIDGASTFHRYFKISPKGMTFGNACTDLDCLIVDEFSMLGGRLFSALDRHLRKTRNSPAPFGGLTIMFSGDIMQLRPVKDDFIVMTRSWHSIDTNMLVLQLDKMYRFKDDPEWGEMLKEIRRGELSDSTRTALESRRSEESSFEDVHFFPRRKEASKLNMQYLRSLPGSTIVLEAPLGTVKIGARVMMTHNSQIDDGISNGSCGVLASIQMARDKNVLTSVCVNFDGVGMITVTRTPEEPMSKKKIIPLVLARAMTIHKAQGATVSKMRVNICGSFAAGQAYVGLSRVRTRAGLSIIGDVPATLPVDEFSCRFDEWTRSCSTLEAHNHFLRDDELKSYLAEASSEDGPRDHLVTLRRTRGEKVYEIVSSPYADEDAKDLDIDDQIMVISRAKSTRRVFKAIFFDFETYHSERHGRHVVYAVFARYVQYDAGEESKKRPCTCKQLASYEDWLTADESKGTHDNDLVANRFFEWVIGIAGKHESELSRAKYAANTASTIYLSAFNGNKFDLFWFARFILQDEGHAGRYSTSLTTRGSSSLVSLVLTGNTIGKPVLASHDIYDMIHMSLAQAVKCYGKDDKHCKYVDCGDAQEAVEKDVFPHSFITDETYPAFANYETMCVPRECFPKKDLASVDKLVSTGELDISKFELRKHSEQYLKKDVDALLKVYVGFDKTCRMYTEGPSLFNFCTMAQLTWYCYLRNLEPEYIAYEKYEKKKDARHRVTKLFRLSREDDQFVGRSIFGGCVFPRINEFESKDAGKSYDEIRDYLVDFDLCSMYVHIMINFEFPIGEHRWGIEVDKARYLDAIMKRDLGALEFAILEVEFRFEKDELHPAVPHRHHVTDALLWANCAVDDAEDKTCTSYEKGNFIRGIYTSVDIENMLRNKAEFKPIIHRLMFWPEKGHVLRKWVQTTFDMKMQADKDKSEVNKAIAECTLEGPARAAFLEKCEEKLTACASLRQFGKTMGNALYGSTAKRDHNSTFALIQDNEDLEEFMNNYKWTDSSNIERYQQKLDQILVLHGEPLVDDSNIMCSRPRYLGAFVLSYTRQMIGKLVNLINPKCRGGGVEGIKMQPFYGDTDSLFAHADAIPRLMDEIGEGHGKLTDDMFDGWNKGKQKDGVTPLFAKITEARFLKPKEYAVKAILPDNSSKSTIKLKGIPSAKRGTIEVEWNDGGNGVAHADEVSYDTLKWCEILRRDVQRMRADGVAEDVCKQYFDGLKITSARMDKKALRLSKVARAQGKSLFTINNADMSRSIFRAEWGGRKQSSALGHPYLVPHGYGYECEEQSDEPCAKRARI